MNRAFLVPRRADLAAMFSLAVPVVVVQVGMMLMGVVDTMVVGRVSAEALAAVALGNLAVVAVSVFGMGLLLALDPVVAQAVGAGDEPAVCRAVQRGLLLAVLVTIPTTLLLLPVEPVMSLLRQPPDTVPIAAGFVYRSLPGLLPFFGFIVLRQTLQAHERMRPIVTVIIAANVLNLVLDVVLVFGLLGAPVMGAFGAAWATTACRYLLFLGLLFADRRELVPLLSRVDGEALRLRPLLAMARLGAPIGLQIQLEVAAFGVIGLLMGGLGTIEMAAHQVAINLASLTFMVPLGVASASAVRVGHAIGRADGPEVRRAAGAALACGVGFMACTALLFLALPRAFASAYTSEVAVVGLAAALIPIAGVFQIFDGVQVVSSGILRGLGDTRAPMVINVLGFWLVGMPVSLGLAFGLGLGPRGLWWGLVAGIAAVAALLLARIASRLSRPMARVVVDEPSVR
ncbi:MAG: MATE family efflux transporter [Holophagae bacterium]|nr:MAG: MATE family efflux transporter [Holophagae bacterium]